MGQQHLLAHLRRAPGDGRAAGRQVRPTSVVPLRHHRVPRRLPAGGRGDDPVVPHRGASSASRRRGDDAAELHRGHQRALHGPPPSGGLRPVGRSVRRCGRPRPAARRLPRGVLVVAAGVPHQHSGRHPRRDPRAAHRPRDPGGRHRAARPAGSGALRIRSRPHRVRAHRGPAVRLVAGHRAVRPRPDLVPAGRPVGRAGGAADRGDPALPARAVGGQARAAASGGAGRPAAVRRAPLRLRQRRRAGGEPGRVRHPVRPAAVDAGRARHQSPRDRRDPGLPRRRHPDLRRRGADGIGSPRRDARGPARDAPRGAGHPRHRRHPVADPESVVAGHRPHRLRPRARLRLRAADQRRARRRPAGEVRPGLGHDLDLPTGR